ncbi:hypothetical protein TNCV_333681 [Trichonephila clavipes]|nr:hypothetical protein TNCV_333681 [Trichonephila clavipes]
MYGIRPGEHVVSCKCLGSFQHVTTLNTHQGQVLSYQKTYLIKDKVRKGKKGVPHLLIKNKTTTSLQDTTMSWSVISSDLSVAGVSVSSKTIRRLADTLSPMPLVLQGTGPIQFMACDPQMSQETLFRSDAKYTILLICSSQ